MKRRARWLAMFWFSTAIGFCVLVFRFLQAAAVAQLYSHPAPVRALLLTARDHADEYAGFRERGDA